MKKRITLYLILIIILFYPLRTQVEIKGYLEEIKLENANFKGGVRIKLNVYDFWDYIGDFHSINTIITFPSGGRHTVASFMNIFDIPSGRKGAVEPRNSSK